MNLTKHLAGLLAAAASSVVLGAPLLSEGFNDIATLPGDGWVLINDSAPPGSTGWFQGNPAVFPAASGPADSYIAANFNNAAFGGTVSNWLLTPQLDLVNGESLNFSLRLLGEGVRDQVEVYVSDSGASAALGDFSLLSTYSSDVDTGWAALSNPTIGAPTRTVAPGSAYSAPITPSNGEGSCTIALAVSTSARGWLRVTLSPTATCHSTISDSVRPSPRSGSAKSFMPTTP